MFAWLKKYFIPHSKNDYKPHFLRYKSALLVLFLILIVEIAFLVQIFIVFDKTSFLASVLPGVLTTLTNEERAQNDAGPLTQNDLLAKAAELKAQDMASNGYFAHTSPDGKTPWYWLDQVGYHYKLAGENLAVNFFESTDVAEAWMNSPTHRDNIVKKNYTEIGIGVANGKYEGRNTVFVAQFFGTPVAVASAPIIPTTPVKKTTTTAKTPVKLQPQPKAGQPPAEKVTPPQAVAIAPTAVQVLGEETTKVLTSPRDYVSYLYGGIALIVILAILLAIFIKREIQHPAILTRGVAIVAIIILLLFVNIKIFTSDTKVPTDTLSASVIAY